ncbi:CBS domain-containing protein [Actinosynnema sp. NPDC059335]|uniref:CBS domain-containing protein n=1 Tax=Actinosynnema sp. NPDC059335 TaxID=3346804 RepID=UPI003671993B
MREPDVASLMTRVVVGARPGTPFKEVAAMVTDGAFSAVPVLDTDGRPIGVVSEADLLPKEEYRGGTEPGPSVLAGRGAKQRWRQAHGVTAADVMTTPVATIGPDEPASAAARELAARNVRRLFVVDTGGRLVGVLSRRDLLRVFLRTDEELRREVADRVVRRALWLDPAAVTVEVVDGVVTLRGHVERRSEADIAVRLTRAMPGVVQVTDDLSYDWDDNTGHRVG